MREQTGWCRPASELPEGGPGSIRYHLTTSPQKQVQALIPPPDPPVRTAVATDDAEERRRLLTQFYRALQSLVDNSDNNRNNRSE